MSCGRGDHVAFLDDLEMCARTEGTRHHGSSRRVSRDGSPRSCPNSEAFVLQSCSRLPKDGDARATVGVSARVGIKRCHLAEDAVAHEYTSHRKDHASDPMHNGSGRSTPGTENLLRAVNYPRLHTSPDPMRLAGCDPKRRPAPIRGVMVEDRIPLTSSRLSDT